MIDLLCFLKYFAVIAGSMFGVFWYMLLGIILLDSDSKICKVVGWCMLILFVLAVLFFAAYAIALEECK